MVDATTGALGLSVLKAGTKVVGGIRYATGAMKLEKAEDAASAIRAGFAVARQGVAEISAIKGIDMAVRRITPRDWEGTAKSVAMHVGVTGAALQLSGVTSGPLFSTKGGQSRQSRKTWCRRHKQYDFC